MADNGFPHGGAKKEHGWCGIWKNRIIARFYAAYWSKIEISAFGLVFIACLVVPAMSRRDHAVASPGCN
ncbi:MAG: hypothetical protein NTZ14_15400 [Hyphomicrobiales bacterium]|nr:hypothetical protein [Hyphomicrobiales bacterium]